MHWKDWCWSWSYNTLTTWYKESVHWKRPRCWERLKAGAKEDNRGWDCWMALLTQWTRVWASAGRWQRTGKPGVLQSMGSQRVTQTWLSDWTGWWCPTRFCFTFTLLTWLRACVLSHFSCVWLCATLCTAALQLFMGFSRQEYWTGLPFPSPGDLSNPGIKLESFESHALVGGFFTTSTTWEAPDCIPLLILEFNQQLPAWSLNLQLRTVLILRIEALLLGDQQEMSVLWMVDKLKGCG